MKGENGGSEPNGEKTPPAVPLLLADCPLEVWGHQKQPTSKPYSHGAIGVIPLFASGAGHAFGSAVFSE
jgi:hypothetical protein